MIVWNNIMINYIVIVNSLHFVSGWRLRKQFFLIKPTDPTKKDIRNILTWVYEKKKKKNM